MSSHNLNYTTDGSLMTDVPHNLNYTTDGSLMTDVPHNLNYTTDGSLMTDVLTQPELHYCFQSQHHCWRVVDV